MKTLMPAEARRQIGKNLPENGERRRPQEKRSDLPDVSKGVQQAAVEIQHPPEKGKPVSLRELSNYLFDSFSEPFVELLPA